MSSCLSGGGQTYAFDLDIVKSLSPSARSSSCSSTLSESSNSPQTISTKRARTPRKRPNQTYTEAAALLSTVYPKVFSTKNLGRLCKHTRPYDSFSESSELLPPFPALDDADFLIREPPSKTPIFRIEPKSVNSLGKAPPSNEFRQPGSPGPLEEDFDTESILDEETEEGIDSIMGNLSMSNNGSNKDDPVNYNAQINPCFRSPMGFGFGGKFELGLAFWLRSNMRWALRGVDDGEWWRSPTVAVQDIVPKFKALSPSEKKKKKKKKVEEEVEELPATATTSSQENLRSSPLLKLNYEVVLKEWSDRGSPFSDASGNSPESTADILARRAEIDLFPESASGGGSGDAGGVREASVMRYREKRQSRLFAKKIRYQVRKVNADQRPRMKASGRFVKRPSLLQEAIEEGSQ